MELSDGPRIVERPDRQTIGIREVVPFRHMLAERDKLLKELLAWLSDREVVETGPIFLRLHVVDMQGSMDIEVGVEVDDRGVHDDRVRPGVLPAGRYATLTYRVRSLEANRILLDWADGNHHDLDHHPGDGGEHWTARTEEYLTDPRTQPRKKLWDVQLNFRVAD